MRSDSFNWARAPADVWASSSCSSSSASGTPCLFTPSSSAVSPQRSSDSVKTILARVKLLSSCASCSIVSFSKRLMASWSGAGTVENAAVNVISAIDASSLRRSHARHLVDDRDHARVVEVQDPGRRIEPRLLDGLRLDLVPLRTGQGCHLHRIDRLLTRLFQQYPYLVRRATRGDLPPETKFGIARRLLELRMLAEVLVHALLDLRLPPS